MTSAPAAAAGSSKSAASSRAAFDGSKRQDYFQGITTTRPPRAGALHDAGARRRGGCLQSSLKWVRLPPASFGGSRDEGPESRVSAFCPSTLDPQPSTPARKVH